MSQVVDFEEGKRRLRLRKQPRTLYKNDLPRNEESDIILSSVTVSKIDNEVFVVVSQIDMVQDPPIFDTVTFSQEDLPVLIEALIEVDQCLSKEEEH